MDKRNFPAFVNAADEPAKYDEFISAFDKWINPEARLAAGDSRVKAVEQRGSRTIVR
jgi:hypothetical protein